MFTGSRLEYGRVGSDPVAETHDVDPLCVHAIHKLMAEQYLRLYQRLYGISYAVARITNPYGPGQPRSRIDYGVVNRLIHLALAGETLPIYGDGRQRRDYIYIDDVVEALLALGSSEGPLWRPRASTTSAPASARRSRTWRKPSRAPRAVGACEFVPWPQLAEQIETGDFVADISRIRAELGWQPAVAAGRRSAADGGLLSDARSVVTNPEPRGPSPERDRIRVVYMAHTFAVGGAEEMVLNLVRHLPPRFEPMVCCISEAGPIGAEIARTGTPVSVLGLTPGLRHPWHLGGIRRYLREVQPAIVHTFLLTASLYGRLAAMLEHVPDRHRHRSEHLRTQATAPHPRRAAADESHRSRDRVCAFGA